MSEVFEVAIGRTRVGWGARVSLDPAVAVTASAPTEQVPRIARMLALAHVMQRMIDRGEVKDQAELARMLGFTRARVTQILDLTLLAPDIQEEIVLAEGNGARTALRERDVRGLCRAPWKRQRVLWARD